MAKLYFYYSTMNAGKTTALLQSKYNYEKTNINTMTFIPKIANKYGIIESRIGISTKAIVIDNKFNIFKYVLNNKKQKNYIFIDEVQFLKKKNIFQLINIVDNLNINVYTYGLRTDFKSELFEGSKYLLSFADEIIEIKTICFCGKKATMNVRLNQNGKKTISGNKIEINKSLYVQTCRKHFYQYNKIKKI